MSLEVRRKMKAFIMILAFTAAEGDRVRSVRRLNHRLREAEGFQSPSLAEMAKSSTRAVTPGMPPGNALVAFLLATPGADTFNAGNGLPPTVHQGSRLGLGPIVNRMGLISERGTKATSGPGMRLHQNIRMSSDEDDMRKALAERLKKDAAEDSMINKFFKKQEPKKGLAPVKEGDERLPIRKGGAVRDGSLGDLRAALATMQTLVDPRKWQAEEYGLIGFFIFLFGSIAYFYATFVDPPEFVPPPENTAYERCLAKAFGFSEQNICRIKNWQGEFEN